MEIFEIVLIALMILGLFISMIVAYPMRKHLMIETDIKNIGLFQMPFYLKDYNSMIGKVENISDRNKYRRYFIIFLISNTGFIVAGIILLFLPGSL